MRCVTSSTFETIASIKVHMAPSIRGASDKAEHRAGMDGVRSPYVQKGFALSRLPALCLRHVPKKFPIESPPKMLL